MSDIMENAPEHFVCPLTMEVMTSPLKNVVTGQSFEAASIRSWMFIEGKGTCPLTRKPISPSDFIDNRALQLEIQLWKEKHQIVVDEEEEDDDEDDEIFLEALESAKKIQQMTTARYQANDNSHQRLMDLGTKVLQQRDQKLSRCVVTRRPSQNIPRTVDDIFALYQ